MQDNLNQRVAIVAFGDTLEGYDFWCKWIDGLNPTGRGGFHFTGDFIPKREIEYSTDMERLILACHDPNQNPDKLPKNDREKKPRTFKVVRLKTDDSLEVIEELTCDDNHSNDWSGFLYEKVEKMLDQIIADFLQNMSPVKEQLLLPEVSDIILIAALEQRGYIVTKPKWRQK